MAIIKTIEWGDGSGDKIYLDSNASEGNQTVTVSSDANTGAARSKIVTFISDIGNITQQITVNQEAGEIPGSLISDYVQDGLYFLLDGKNKGNVSGSWTSVAGNTFSFSNVSSNAVFNSDHVYFNGTNAYFRSTSPAANAFPNRTTGTIEVVIENENFGSSLGVIIISRNGANRIAAAITSGKNFRYASDTTNSRSYYCPIVTTSKASISVSSARYYENGNMMTLSSDKSYLSGISSSYNYIGRNNNGYYFKGKIYSIRVYTRQLSQAEILQNLSVDNLRFNLGLTL